MGILASGIDIRVLFVVLGVIAIAVGGVLARVPEVRHHH